MASGPSTFLTAMESYRNTQLCEQGNRSVEERDRKSNLKGVLKNIHLPAAVGECVSLKTTQNSAAENSMIPQILIIFDDTSNPYNYTD
jgi:hypothetical protein